MWNKQRDCENINMDKDDLIVVTGAGGFIGGQLVSSLLAKGFKNLRAVDVKPFEGWYQKFGEVENIQADLQEYYSCDNACKGARYIFNLAADMGGMGFIENNKAACMLSVLINTNMLQASKIQN